MMFKRFNAAGTDDPDALPFFHYREDALVLWNAIKKYIRAIVTAFYKCDDVSP